MNTPEFPEFEEQPVDPIMLAPEEQAREKRFEGWWKRSRVKIALGAVAVSTAATLMMSPLEETIDSIEDDVPTAVAAGVGMVAMEAVWIGGAAMMVGAAGRRVARNPLRIRSQLKDIAEDASKSKTFKAGFWINTGAAVSQFAIPTALVVSQLPPESWGILAPAVVDLGATVVLRHLILDGIKTATAEPTE